MKPIALLALCISVGAAAQSWSLQDCISYALEHNINVKQSELRRQDSEVALNSAESRRLPAFAASASENLSFGRGLTADNTYSNSNTTSTSFQLGGELPVFQGFEISRGIKIAKLQLEAATSQLEKAREDVSVAVAQAYVEILYAQEILKVADTQAEYEAQLLKQIEAKRDVGLLSDADVSAQKASLAKSKLDAVQASGSYQIALLALTQLLELESPEDFSIVSPAVEGLDKQLFLLPSEIYATALSFKPSIKSAEQLLASSEIAIDRAKSGYLPSLSLNGGIGTNFYTSSNANFGTFGEQLKNNFSQYVGLSLNIPIFSRNATRNAVRSAQIARNNSALELDNTRKTLYKEIQQAYYNAITAQAKLSSSEESAKAALYHYELIVEKYSAGKANISEYNDAKNNHLTAESNHLKAKYECLFQAKLLDFYRGEALNL